QRRVRAGAGGVLDGSDHRRDRSDAARRRGLAAPRRLGRRLAELVPGDARHHALCRGSHTTRRSREFLIDAHSARNASTGSTLAARRAGTYAASNATARRSAGTAPNVIGSVGDTPNKNDDRRRVAPKAAAIPIPIP